MQRNRENVGMVLDRMVQYDHTNPAWERSASLLFLLGTLFACTSVLNRFMFSLGHQITESVFLLEVLFPCVLLFFVTLCGLDRAMGIPIDLSRFASWRVLGPALPCAFLFALRNTLPAYAMSMSKQGNMRDFVFCTNLVQPILVFAVEGTFTARRLWKWHTVSMFVLVSGVSLFLFHTHDSTVSGNSIPLMGSMSKPLATLTNLTTAFAGAGFFVLFARQATAKEGERQWLPLQDLIAFNFVVALCVQVILSLLTNTLKDEVRAISAATPDMFQRLIMSTCLNSLLLFIRMVCLAKTSCILTSLVPVYFLVPIRMVLGSQTNTTSMLGVVTASVGMIGFTMTSFTEHTLVGRPSMSWVVAVTNMDRDSISQSIRRCVAVVHAVALFSLVFPIVCRFVFHLPVSYILWSVALTVVPLALIAHIGIHVRRSVFAVYLCAGLLMFSFLPLQFGPITGAAAVVCFLIELVMMYFVGAGLDAVLVYNGFRPGYVPFVESSTSVLDEKHDAELDAVVSQFIIGEDDDDDY